MTPGEAEDTEQAEEEWRPGGQLRGRDEQIEAGPGLVTEYQTQEEEERQADGSGHRPPEPGMGMRVMVNKKSFFKV